MTFNQIIWIMWFYIAIYYLLARYVASEINRIDPSYFEYDYPDGKLPIGMSTSLGIVRLIFDGDMPEAELGTKIRLGLYIVRAMFALCLPAAIFLVWI